MNTYVLFDRGEERGCNSQSREMIDEGRYSTHLMTHNGRRLPEKIWAPFPVQFLISSISQCSLKTAANCSVFKLQEQQWWYSLPWQSLLWILLKQMRKEWQTGKDTRSGNKRKKKRCFLCPETCYSQPPLCHCSVHVGSQIPQISQKCTSCTLSWCSSAEPAQWGCEPRAHHRPQHFSGHCFISLCSHWVWPQETSAASCVPWASRTHKHLGISKIEKEFKLHVQGICSHIRISSFCFRINANKPLNLILHLLKNKNHYISTKS